MTSEILIMIPARGGSKRLPDKNVKALAGQTLLKRVSRVVTELSDPGIKHLVSTDNERIAALAKSCGLSVPYLRPAHLATDDASTVDVTLHALDWLKEAGWADPNIVVLLQITSPFRDVAKIRQAIEILETGARWDAVISMKELHRSPRTLFSRNVDGGSSPLGDCNEPADLMTPNGNFYVVRTDVFRRERTFFPSRMTAMVMNPIQSIDIDTPSDWSIAEAVAVHLRSDGAA